MWEPVWLLDLRCQKKSLFFFRKNIDEVVWNEKALSHMLRIHYSGQNYLSNNTHKKVVFFCQYYGKMAFKDPGLINFNTIILDRFFKRSFSGQGGPKSKILPWVLSELIVANQKLVFINAKVNWQQITPISICPS